MHLRSRPLLLVVLALTIGSACGGTVPASKTTVSAAPLAPRPPPAREAAPDPACALGIEGALVVFEETPDGARLYLLAAPGERDELRARARDVAANGANAEHPLAIVKLPDARLEEDDIEEGAVLDFIPLAVKDRDPLRVRVYERALALNDACRWELLERHLVHR